MRRIFPVVRYEAVEHKARGFTLLELLLVLSILGGIVSLVAPNLTGLMQQDKAKTEVLALKHALQTVIDQAWLTGRNSFIELRQGKLLLWQQQGKEWQSLGAVYTQRADVDYQLNVSAEKVRNAQQNLDMAGNMTWVALSNAEYLPFRWRIKGNISTYTLIGDGINGLQIEP